MPSETSKNMEVVSQAPSQKPAPEAPVTLLVTKTRRVAMPQKPTLVNKPFP